MPHGHGDTQLTLPFGAPARLRVAASQVHLSFSDYPYLHSRAENPAQAGPSANP
jgi:muramoyltetrapeptide carboxypeptidase